MTQDYRRNQAPDEAYGMQTGVGDEDYLRTLRAEVRPPDLPGSRQEPVHRMAPKPGTGIKPRQIVIGLVGVVVILSAIIGHAMSGGSNIKAGDCVITNPNAVTEWDIKKVNCSSPPQAEYYQVASVQSGSNGNCGGEYTTLNDEPANQTYCLAQRYSFNAPGG